MVELNIVPDNPVEMKCPWCGNNEFKIFSDNGGMAYKCTKCDNGRIVGGEITIRTLIEVVWNLEVERE